MSKRKLNKRQQWRIEKIQSERIKRAGTVEKEIQEAFDHNQLGEEQSGRIVAHFGSQVELESIQDTSLTIRCHLRANLGSLVTGDLVIFRTGQNNEGVVVAICDRSNSLSRPNSHGEIKPVAANIDYILLLVACEPLTYSHLIDRYLVAAENCHIEPILLLNKIDLLDEQSWQEMNELLAPYIKLGYRTMNISALKADSLKELNLWLAGKTCVFVGQSGIGKSSLIQTLLPEQTLRIGEISQANKKGKHTTTTARLYHFPEGGNLIDSPGIREFGLWHMTPEEILYGFKELREYVGLCKFRDCKHEKEPKCALKTALNEGHINPRRFESYQRILNTLTEL
jgi:ribosome biogenesis GTPase